MKRGKCVLLRTGDERRSTVFLLSPYLRKLALETSTAHSDIMQPTHECITYQRESREAAAEAIVDENAIRWSEFDEEEVSIGLKCLSKSL